MLDVIEICSGYGKTQILDGISLRVAKGEVVALLGGNGTGKSTVLKTIVGLLRPTSGEIWFDGKRIDGEPARAMIGNGIGMVSQGKEVFAEMTVEENLLMGAFHRRRHAAAIKRDLEEAYTRFPRLGERRRTRAGALSGGEREMLSIARTLMGQPRFLMLDEPSAALSPRAVEDVIDILWRLKEQGMTFLLVEQNVSVALALAERIYILRDGKIAMERKVDAATSFDDLKFYYLGGEEQLCASGEK